MGLIPLIVPKRHDVAEKVFAQPICHRFPLVILERINRPAALILMRRSIEWFHKSETDANPEIRQLLNHAQVVVKFHFM